MDRTPIAAARPALSRSQPGRSSRERLEYVGSCQPCDSSGRATRNRSLTIRAGRIEHRTHCKTVRWRANCILPRGCCQRGEIRHKDAVMAKKKQTKVSTAIPTGDAERILWTVGHSTRPIDAFLEVLAAGGIELLADVRRYPGSRRYPQFNQEALTASLTAAGIEYRHFVDLGGRRTKRLPESPNTAWRVEAFNAYADHTQSAEFLAAMENLLPLAAGKRTAIMCSEALPQQCHRRIIADVLVARGWAIRHLLAPKRIEDHQLTPFARVAGASVSYPAETLF